MKNATFELKTFINEWPSHDNSKGEIDQQFDDNNCYAVNQEKIKLEKNVQ